MPIQLDNEQLEAAAETVLGADDQSRRYAFNEEMYKEALLELPSGDWPDRLVKYAKVRLEDMPYGVSEEDMDEVAKLQTRDWFRILVHTERREKRKCDALCESVKRVAGPKKLDEAIKKLKQRKAALAQ